jgi:hypothetical protein
MVDYSEAFKRPRFLRTPSAISFANKNLESLFLLFSEEIKENGVVNLKDVADAIRNYYDSTLYNEVGPLLYKLCDGCSLQYGLSIITLLEGLRKSFPEYADFKPIMGGSGGGKIKLTRFLYEEEGKLIDFFKSRTQDLGRIEKKKQVFYVRNLFRTS